MYVIPKGLIWDMFTSETVFMSNHVHFSIETIKNMQKISHFEDLNKIGILKLML